MALSRTEAQITWSAANTKTLSATTRSDSDEVVFDSTDIGCAIQVRVDNQRATPVTGEVLNVYIKYTTGDLDAGGGSNDYDTDEHAALLMVLDTYGTNTPGEDPATKTVDIPVTAKGFKLSVQAPGWTSGGDMVVSARRLMTRAA